MTEDYIPFMRSRSLVLLLRQEERTQAGDTATEIVTADIPTDTTDIFTATAKAMPQSESATVLPRLAVYEQGLVEARAALTLTHSDLAATEASTMHNKTVLPGKMSSRTHTFLSLIYHQVSQSADLKQNMVVHGIPDTAEAS